MKKIAFAVLVIFSLGILSGCGSGGGSSPAPATATLTGIAIIPASTTVAKGQNALLSATGTYSDATTANLTSQVTWASGNTGVATINSTTGVATSVGVGSTAITATLNGVTSPATTLQVTAAVITGISITPTAPTTPKGTPVTFTATGTYSDGTTGNASASVSWTSGNTAVATLNASGIASSLAQGTTTVTASANGVTSNSATLTVTAPVIAAIAINPATSSVAKGLTTSFTATGTYTDATTANITSQVVWASGNTGVATINASTGVATGVAVGNTTVTASVSGIAASAASLSVTAAVITGISITPTAPSTPKGTPVTFTATGTYSDGTTGNISGSVAWVSGSTTVATLNSTGIASSLSQGSSTITASANSVTSNSATLTVTAPALASLSITPLSASIVVGQTKQFSASGILTDGTAATLGTLTWTSSGTAVATISSTGLAAAVAVGSTNISAGSGGITSNAAVLLVSAAPIGTQMGGARQAVLLNSAAVVTTFAGPSNATCTADGGFGYCPGGVADGVGNAARFAGPWGLTTDGINLYDTDLARNTIRQTVIATGQVTTLAGTPSTIGAIGDGTGAAALFNGPTGITTDGANLYIADSGNNTIRKLVIATGQVTTFAGPDSAVCPSGVCPTGTTDGIGTLARFSNPYGITTDGTNLYVTDSGNCTIRMIAIATAQVTTLAGSCGYVDGVGTAAGFSAPHGIVTDGTNLFVADTANQTIRKVVIATQQVTTIAGTRAITGFADGTGTAAQFNYPGFITTDGTNLYITDSGNYTVRQMSISTNQVTTLAGVRGGAGYADGTGTAAQFWGFSVTISTGCGITTDGKDLYLTDFLNNTIRKIH